ncbi:hypothetical protein [Alteromonas lipotrueae]|uniref:hypothetical protein n=1 Tax=Alteromonas lipotrueae TaxID=2803814 RepID=UPI001C452A6D|nr:hypothetical protein [Alteromonas lipotrueae]
MQSNQEMVKTMDYEELLHWCIFRSPKRTAKSAAEMLGIHPVQFGQWRNWEKSNCTPTDEQCVKIADLCALDPYVVWLSVQSAKVKNDTIKSALKSRIDTHKHHPLMTGTAQ